MKTKVILIVMSLMSDAQAQMSFDLKGANKSINFAKWLLLEFSDTNTEITDAEKMRQYKLFNV